MRQHIEQEALRLGLTACGFAKAEPVDDEAARILDHWTGEGYHAGMGYMERNRELRLDPTLLVPGCRTLIVVALNYYPQRLLPKEGYQIAYYAYGADYHRVMKDKLYHLLSYIKTLVPEVKGRAFCDTAPLLERYWAVQAGLGLIGRNRTLIIPSIGSYFFLGVLAIDATIEIPPKGGDSLAPLCTSCNRCIKACPTGALTLEGIDCRRCLSYLTIEHKGPLPIEVGTQLDKRIFGCDTCQQVCPYNRDAKPTGETQFDMSPEIASLTPTDWQNLSPEQYSNLMKGSAMERAGYEGLLRNINALKKVNR